MCSLPVVHRSMPLDQRPAHVYLARLSPSSLPAMRHALERLAALASSGSVGAALLDWSALRYQHTAALRARLVADYAPATVNRMLSALRGVLKEAWKLGQMTAEHYHRAVALEPVRGSQLPAGRALADDELQRTLRTCMDSDEPLRVRDGAILCVLYGSGMRRTELVFLDLADYEDEQGCLTIRRGKGRKARTTYVANECKRALDRWVYERGGTPGPLFVPIGRTRRLSPQTIYNVVKRHQEAAGTKHFSPHDLRRTCITNLIDRGADLGAVRDFAGHANAQTTLRYDRRGERAKREAAALLTLGPGQNRS